MSRPDRTLFVDGASGASGDMILGALVDAGVPAARLKRAFDSLGLGGWTLRSRRIVRCGLAGRKIDIRVRGDAPGCTWRQLRRTLAAGALDPRVRERSLAVFRRLFEAESEVHGVRFDRVHLHEAGGTDAILDVVGACFGLEHLGATRVVVSPLTTGHGRVRCAHGLYPVPGPATMNLLRGVPVRAGDVEFERLTPTGAAILTTVADAWGPMPAMVPAAVGYGAGDRELPGEPNMLRIVLGDSGGAGASRAVASHGDVVVLECTVDDATPQTLAYACERLFEAGALEAFTAPVTMKKSRAGHHLTVLGRVAALDSLSRILFNETSTIGLRVREERRLELERDVIAVSTRYGTIRVKRSRFAGRTIQVRPEYDDCAARAREHSVPLRQVQAAALAAANQHVKRKTKESK